MACPIPYGGHKNSQPNKLTGRKKFWNSVHCGIVVYDRSVTLDRAGAYQSLKYVTKRKVAIAFYNSLYYPTSRDKPRELCCWWS